MACEYCEKKFQNKPLIDSPDKTHGVMAWVEKRDEGAYLCAYVWFDGAGGFGPYHVKINYCPNCGAKIIWE